MLHEYTQSMRDEARLATISLPDPVRCKRLEHPAVPEAGSTSFG